MKSGQVLAAIPYSAPSGARLSVRSMPTDPKSCVVCGRTIEWRRKWERSWNEVKYCSAACRKRKASVADGGFEADILELLAARARGASICPSEIARARSADPEEWRALMEPVREAARRLVAAGRVVITQQGHEVDPSTAKGPIRIRLSTRLDDRRLKER